MTFCPTVNWSLRQIHFLPRRHDLWVRITSKIQLMRYIIIVASYTNNVCMDLIIKIKILQNTNKFYICTAYLILPFRPEVNPRQVRVEAEPSCPSGWNRSLHHWISSQTVRLKMTYFNTWEEFAKATERLYINDPSRVRYYLWELIW